jgi:chromosomal replication initiator protein
LALTQQALKYLTDAKDEKKYITIDEITKSVCEYYRIPYKELMGKKKTKDISMPRQIAMYLCRELTGNTYPHIGTAFNGRDHSTVMHACSKVSATMKKDEHFREKIEELKNKISGVDN